MDVQKVQSLINIAVAEHAVLRNMGKVLLSFALFMSLLFSNPPCDVAFFFHHFPSRLFNLLSDKNYVFLLCNGIIVILAKSYRVFTSFDDQSHSPEVHDQIQDYVVEETSGAQPIFISTANNAELLEAEDETRAFVDQLHMNAGGEEVEEDKEVLVEDIGPEEEMEVEYEFSLDEESLAEREDNERFEDHEEEEEEESMEYSWLGDEEEEEGEDEQSEEERYIASMSTEELNRKFEEFIRKMKEEIRIEARNQLVMV